MKDETKKIISIIPMLLIVGIMPLIVYFKLDILSENILLNSKGRMFEIDMFVYYKGIFTIVMSLCSIMIFFINNKKKKIQSSLVYKYILIYIVCIVLSTMLSDYKDMSINGTTFRYEGILMLISYMIILFISINIFNTSKSINLLMLVLAISSSIISLIGIMQFCGYDIFQIELFQNIFIPNKYNEFVGNLNFVTKGSKMAYSTFTNSNYMGSYIALVFPMMLCMCILSDRYKYFYGVISILNLVVLVLSDSAGGAISICITTVILIILLRKEIFNQYKKVTFIVIAAVSLILLGDFSTNKIIYSRVYSAISEFKYELNVGKEVSKLQEVVMNDDEVSIIYKDNNLKIKLIGEKISFYGENGQDLSIEQSSIDKTWKFRDKNYNDIKIVFDNINYVHKNYMKINIDDDISIRLTTDEGRFKYITYGGRIIEDIDIKYWFKDGMEEVLTSRIYIWSRILPLIVQKPLFGYGPDTFAAVFPQYDYVGMYKAYDNTNMIVDKAHNMYIQIAQSTGILSLVALGFIVILYMKESLRSIKNETKEKDLNVFRISILLGVTGYLVVGFINDSIVSVTPIFYCFLGCGISISNMKNSE